MNEFTSRDCPADILLISFNLLGFGVRGGVIHDIVMQSGPPVARSNPPQPVNKVI
jgi:hypothetical protein